MKRELLDLMESAGEMSVTVARNVATLTGEDERDGITSLVDALMFDATDHWRIDDVNRLNNRRVYDVAEVAAARERMRDRLDAACLLEQIGTPARRYIIRKIAAGDAAITAQAIRLHNDATLDVLLGGRSDTAFGTPATA